MRDGIYQRRRHYRVQRLRRAGDRKLHFLCFNVHDHGTEFITPHIDHTEEWTVEENTNDTAGDANLVVTT